MHELRNYIDKLERTQADLAVTLGISRPYLTLLLSGKKMPSLELAIRIELATNGEVPANSWVKSKTFNDHAG